MPPVPGAPVLEAVLLSAIPVKRTAAASDELCSFGFMFGFKLGAVQHALTVCIYVCMNVMYVCMYACIYLSI